MSIGSPARVPPHAPPRPVSPAPSDTPPRRASPTPSPAVSEDDEPDWLECDRTALIQAQAQAWAHVLPTLPPGDVPNVLVRMVTPREFGALLAAEPLHAMGSALQTEDGDPLGRVVRWVGRTLRRFFSPEHEALALPPLVREVAAYLPSRAEVVFCDAWVPSTHSWSAALRAPLAMAALHHRVPEYLGALLGEWATHVRYAPARARLEMSAELLLTDAAQQNAYARWAWWNVYAALAAASHLLQGNPDAWCQDVAAALAVPKRLVRKLVQLHQQDPAMLLGTLQNPLRVDALARGLFETYAFVPFGQTELTRHHLLAVDRRSPEGGSLLDEEVPVVEFAPLGGTPLDVRQAPVGAADQLLENGFCPQAVRMLEETVYLNPDNIAALLALADLYLKQARADAAQACFERVLTLRPGHHRAEQGMQRTAAESKLAPPDAAILRDLHRLIPAQRVVLPRV